MYYTIHGLNLSKLSCVHGPNLSKLSYVHLKVPDLGDTPTK